MKYFHGSVTEASEHFIIQGCNGQGRMNSGVAKAIRAKWPEVFTSFDQNYRDGRNKLGEVYWIAVNDNSHTIGNAITQQFYGKDGARYINYEAIYSVLEKVGTWLHGRNMPVAMPMIGAGLGGGDWTIISAMIQAIENKFGIQFHIYVMEEDIYNTLVGE